MSDPSNSSVRSIQPVESNPGGGLSLELQRQSNAFAAQPRTTQRFLYLQGRQLAESLAASHPPSAFHFRLPDQPGTRDPAAADGASSSLRDRRRHPRWTGADPARRSGVRDRGRSSGHRDGSGARGVARPSGAIGRICSGSLDSCGPSPVSGAWLPGRAQACGRQILGRRLRCGAQRKPQDKPGTAASPVLCGQRSAMGLGNAAGDG